VEDVSASQKHITAYTIHKLTYADGRAYRYLISDEARQIRYVAERTGMLLPSPTRLVEFFDPDHNLTGRLQPPDVAPWLRVTRYELFVGEEAEEPHAVILEQWRLVDILLLRLPRYELQFGEHRYTIRGSRYGAHFYEIFRPREEGGEAEEESRKVEEVEERAESMEEVEGEPESEEARQDEGDEEEEESAKSKVVKVGQIERPAAGPSYIVEAEAAPLRQSPLVLAALVILIDMEQFS
jgi:hypothetical protein